MRKIKLTWSLEAKADLKGIKRFISRDAPKRAREFIRRLKAHAKRLEAFPESGQAVEELQNPSIREIVFGNYRIIYLLTAKKIEVLTVCHGARLLDEHSFES
jgi:addiction module RelE/StbE family toxin